jgi:hypothetical protein
MKKFMATTCVLIGLMVGLLSAQEPEWNPSRVKECDRACLVGIVEGYMNAIFKHDTKVVPALDGWGNGWTIGSGR